MLSFDVKIRFLFRSYRSAPGGRQSLTTAPFSLNPSGSPLTRARLGGLSAGRGYTLSPCRGMRELRGGGRAEAVGAGGRRRVGGHVVTIGVCA